MKKILKWIGIFLAVLIGLLVVALAAAFVTSNSRANRTYDIQVESVTISTDAETIERGRHLAVTRGCVDCHGDDFRGGSVIDDQAVAARMAEVFVKPPQDEREPQTPFPELTPREHEILELIAQGKSNAEIAEQFTLSLKTVRNHVSNIFNKLQVSDRLQAALRAREVGMGKESTNSP